MERSYTKADPERALRIAATERRTWRAIRLRMRLYGRYSVPTARRRPTRRATSSNPACSTTLASHSACRDVGPFVPLTTDRFGTVVREVATAQFALAVPSRPAEPLLLHVALVRDLRCATPVPPSDEDDLAASDWVPSRDRWLADLSIDAQGWWEEGWVASAAPAPPTHAKRIPIVSTADLGDAVTLARLYSARWPQQENSIRDSTWPVPFGMA